MKDQPVFDIQRNAFLALQRLVRQRAADEVMIAEAARSAAEDADREVQKARRLVAASRKRDMEELDAERAADSLDTATRFDSQNSGIESAFTEARAKSEQQYRIAEAKLRNEYKDRLWTIDSMHEAAEKEAEDDRQARLRQALEAETEITAHWTAAEALLEPFHLAQEDVRQEPDSESPTVEASLENPASKLETALEDAELAAEKLAHCTLPRLVGLWGTVWCVFVAGGLSAAAAAATGLKVQSILGIGLGGAVVGGLLLRQVLWFFARKQVRERGEALATILVSAEQAASHLRSYAELRHADQIGEVTRQHEVQRKQCDDLFLPKIAAIARQGKEVAARLENERSTKLAFVAASRTKAEREARMHFAQRGHAITDTHESQLREAEALHAKKLAEFETTSQAAWQRLADDWFEGLASVAAVCQMISATGDQTFPSWDATLTAPLPTTVPTGIRFGEYSVDPLALPDGRPQDPALLPPAPWKPAVPAFLPFPDRAAVIWKARDQGRAATVAALQAVMLRYLTGLPPGKVRLTIIDPVGLGENFASFMHLADYDELAITSRIWTEPPHIEARLADLTEHMETVIQKYLRNQYKSIEDYNRAAGEVAEPYRVLVIANFPTNFTPEAARRLVAIMSSGPACGVCTLLGVDLAAAPPRDFRLADLDQVAFSMTWKDGRFVPADPALAPFPLTVDTPPPPAEIAAIVRRVGEAGRLTKRVEVPFDNVAPPPELVWTASTIDGFEVAVGRAGATRRQIFALGKGTAQHALIAGKTGSGKSTLLHALITNLALTYSPDEAELYLIDFKKGVEFKMYAEQALPHARVVAIESEREFGISVLHRLDAILRERGDLYRASGANDVASYRDTHPNRRFPRILLVVDEFQEFFVEDDKLAQEASLLLDRLVRQGRAFGVHVLLGSQTLGGAFSLARSTIDQMAVRVALQCSETDAQLILSKDNTAARLLSRPGDAIYNDANGQLQGINPFQVVWLSDERREQILMKLHDRAAPRHDPKPLVFEGNAVANIGACTGLRELVEGKGATTVSLAGPITVWLGEAIAIKDPTAAIFRPQSGSNLLLLGQDEEAALGIQSAALAALIARSRPGADATSDKPPARTIAIVDGTPADAQTADVLHQVTAALGVPHAIVERFDLPAVLTEFASEVERRTSGESTDRQPRFLFVHGLQRLRELRKPEDNFGYGRRGEKTLSPGEQFLGILRDGPSVGIHTIMWCDSVTNLTRAFDRQTLREFTLRVLFQMSANDSSQMMDTPAASRLGRNRALYLEDGLERPEKFRPYAIPDHDWLLELAKHSQPDSPSHFDLSRVEAGKH